MNAACPVCGYHWASNGPKDGEPPIPAVDDYDPRAVGVLHVCSEKCKEKYNANR